MNKLYLYLAFIFYLIGIATVLDWIIFWEYNYNNDFNELKAKYYARFPHLVQVILSSRFSALFFIIAFIFAGVIFIKQKHILFKILGVTSFIFAFWHVFTLM